MRRIILLFVASTLPAANLAYAEPKQDLSEFIIDEISTVDQAFQAETRKTGITEGQSEEAYYMRRFWFRIRAKFGIEVPGFADFEVIPDLEMLWEKEPPNGWEIYHPSN